MSEHQLVTQAAQTQASTWDEETLSVEAVLCTEGPVFHFDYMRGKVEQYWPMEGFKPIDQVPLTDSHETMTLSSQLGSVREIRTQGKQLRGRVYFLDDGEQGAGRRAAALYRHGHARDVSTASVITQVQYIEPGSSAEIYGRTYRAGKFPVRVAVKWELQEVAATAIGLDPKAKVQSAAENHAAVAAAGGQNMSEPNVVPAEPVTQAAAPAAATPAPDAATTQQSAAVDIAGVQRAERERIAALRREGAGLPEAVVQSAIDDGSTVEQARAGAFYTALRAQMQAPASTAPGIIERVDQSAWRGRGLQFLVASQIFNAGADRAVKQFGADGERMADVARQFGGGMSLYDVACEAVAIQGLNASRYDRNATIKQFVSSGAMADIFTTSSNAALISRFSEIPDSTAGMTFDTDVANFLTQERIGVGSFAGLKKLGAGGKAEHMANDAFVETYKAARYAGQLVIDEQDIINDNIGGIQRMFENMVQAAGRLRPDLVISVLLRNANMRDGVALFHAATHGNLGTSGTALSATTLEAQIAAMAKQTYTTADGQTVSLNVTPRFLFVPQDLLFTAQTIVTSAQRIIASASNGTANPLQNLIEVRSDNRLGTAGVVDPQNGTAYAGTATNYFLLADPRVVPTIEVGYLRGTGRVPQVRTKNLDGGQWGIAIDVTYDIGVKALDWRGLRKATGAS